MIVSKVRRGGKRFFSADDYSKYALCPFWSGRISEGRGRIARDQRQVFPSWVSFGVLQRRKRLVFIRFLFAVRYPQKYARQAAQP